MTPLLARRALKAAVAAALVVLAGCAGDAANQSAAPEQSRTDDADPGFGHVHGIGLNPADNTVYAATHYGVFRVEEGKAPTRIGDRQQDTMGFAIAGPDRFLGSGHPDPHDGGPPHLGLIVSTDRAKSWQAVALQGQADFHALAVAGNTIYGWNSTSGHVLRSDDGGQTWTTGASLAVADLAVNPDQPNEVLATTAAGPQRSVDGGATFTPAENAPPMPLIYLDYVPGPYLDLAGLAPDGRLWLLSGKSWRQAARLRGQPHAFSVAGAAHFLAATADGVYAFHNGGATWHEIAKTHS